MTISDAPGAWNNGSSDTMYANYDYPLDNGNDVVTFTNLPAGQYDVLAYSSDGNYEVTVDGTSYGVKTTYDNPVSSVPVWTEGVQYARFRNVTVAAGQSLTLTVRNGVGHYAIISGVQIIGDTMPSAPPCTPPPSGLVGWWKGDGSAMDSVSANNGTLVHAAYTNGVVGEAFSFDPESYPYGTYTGVQVADKPAYALTNSLTIEGWVRPRGDGYVIFFRGDHRPGMDPYALSMQANNQLVFEITDATGNNETLRTVVPYQQWTHVAATLDGSTGLMRIYTNGLLATQITTDVRPFGALLPDQSPGIGIGNVNDGGNNFPFYGDIDEISLYNRALSQSEVQAIYNAGSAGKCASTSSPFLINVDFGSGSTRGYSLKSGFAAAGQTTNDFWNFYDRDASTISGDWRVSGALPRLRLADGTVTTAGMAVSDAPGAWGDGSSDPMYVTYDYPLDGGNNVITFTNLPAGQYDVLAYSPDGNYEVTVGGTSYGVQTTYDSPVSSMPVWTEGVQYARFRNVTV
ncbi:MAG TPA: LamG domain-containing protein, partial [Candidatus Binatia bacterium]|nr:LamG domain-containing protein [Candidatus Binatia bacterium]